MSGTQEVSREQEQREAKMRKQLAELRARGDKTACSDQEFLFSLLDEAREVKAVRESDVRRAIGVYYGWPEHEAVFSAAKLHYRVGLNWDFSAEKGAPQDLVRLRAVLADFAAHRYATPSSSAAASSSPLEGDRSGNA